MVEWCYENLDITEDVQKFYNENDTRWPHDYRLQVYYPEVYGRYWLHNGLSRLTEFLLDKGNIRIKVVRNPYDRAISAYVAFSRNESKGINRHGLDLSFRDFLSCIRERLDKETEPDIHLRRQITGAERKIPGFIDEMVKIEDFNSRIKEMNEKYELSLSSMESKSFVHYYKYGESAGSFCGDIKYSKISGKIPSKQIFYDKSMKDMVLEIFREDIELYGYSFPYD